VWCNEAFRLSFREKSLSVFWSIDLGSTFGSLLPVSYDTFTSSSSFLRLATTPQNARAYMASRRRQAPTSNVLISHRHRRPPSAVALGFRFSTGSLFYPVTCSGPIPRYYL
jgi:hypothetical protein